MRGSDVVVDLRIIATQTFVRTKSAVLTNVGRDNPQIYYNVIPRHESASAAQVFVLCRRTILTTRRSCGLAGAHSR